MIRRVCVFCGSSNGIDPRHVQAAQAFGRALAESNLELVYGGGRVGMMGALADAVLANGGRVIGIIPQFLMDREVGHTGLTDLLVVESMHERKAKMAEMSDAFVALPGGVGTFEEFIEVMTWSLLGLHAKPCAILNSAGYYDLMLRFFDHATNEGFLAERHRNMIVVEREAVALTARLQTYEHTTPPKFSDDEARLT